MTKLTVNLNNVIELSRDQFYQICVANPNVKFERNAKGEIVIMAPTGGETGNRNIEIATDLTMWNRQTNLGKTFDSSTGFTLPNGADRSPDLAWIPIARWNALTVDEKTKFLPLCPDFVVELLSPSDNWLQGQAKLAEYMENGCRMGWLIDPKAKRVAIYRQGLSPEILQFPKSLTGEEVLPGFVLDFNYIWS
jgi:Uma2 family endonuclease